MITPARSFLIVTPCDDGHKLCFWDSVRAFEKLYYLGRLDTPHRFEFRTVPGDSLVPRARNNLAHFFRQGTDFDAIFPLDSDLDFRPQDILQLADLFALYDMDFLCGRYAIKEDGLRWCENALPNGAKHEVEGVIEIATGPGGIHILSRRCIDAMVAAADTWPHWRIRYTDDMAHDERWNIYFNGVVLDTEWWPDRPLGRYLSEDWGISYLARKLGFKIWCDTRVVMLHRGECFYPKNARRMSYEEVQSGMIQQPDGSTTPMRPPEPV
jgi:hypothetical protein